MGYDRLTKSPLKETPLRNPGQSLDEELQNIYVDKVLPLIMAPTLLATFAGVEWLRLYWPTAPSPWFATGIAVLAIAYSVYQLIRIIPRISSLRLGRDGERVVGQSLEELRAGGAIILHDIVGNGFNVDHVVISPHGIYVVETKTFSKPKGKDARVVFDGEKVPVS